MRGHEALEDGGQDVGGDRRRRGHLELARAPALQVVDRAPPFAQGAHGPLRVGHEGAPGLGQAHSVPGSHEKSLAQLAFQGVEPRGQGWLRHVEALRGPAHAVESGYLQEALDMDEEHRRSLYISAADMTALYGRAR